MFFTSVANCQRWSLCTGYANSYDIILKECGFIRLYETIVRFYNGDIFRRTNFFLTCFFRGTSGYCRLKYYSSSLHFKNAGMLLNIDKIHVTHCDLRNITCWLRVGLGGLTFIMPSFEIRRNIALRIQYIMLTFACRILTLQNACLSLCAVNFTLIGF